MSRLKEWARKINIAGGIAYDEPLAQHTTFRVGGPADLFATPANRDDVAALVSGARREGIPWFVLGGGANILVADAGIRGLVIDTTSLAGCTHTATTLVAGAGLAISTAAEYAANHDLAGLAFIYAMPGTVGGAVWMNARCYDGEIFPILESVETVDADGTVAEYLPRAEEWDYKKSPFMSSDSVMTEVRFRLTAGSGAELWRAMEEHRADRTAKGHFLAPCAGSVFKNNRAFGKPSGAIIDALGLRGYRIGNAQVSDLHANIVINSGGATASEIRAVIEHLHDQVAERLGYELEREVLYVGDWDPPTPRRPPG